MLRQRGRHLIDQMATVFDDALVDNWEPLEGGFGLPDPDDEHVVAAAVVGAAGAIVTDNQRDSPETKIPARIKVLSPQSSPQTPCRSLLMSRCMPYRRWLPDTPHRR